MPDWMILLGALCGAACVGAFFCMGVGIEASKEGGGPRKAAACGMLLVSAICVAASVSLCVRSAAYRLGSYLIEEAADLDESHRAGLGRINELYTRLGFGPEGE